MRRLQLPPELGRSRQPPPAFYSDPDVFEHLRERVLARTWQWLAHTRSLEPTARAWPLTLLPGSLDEPVLLTRAGDGGFSAWVNACTHRGHPLATTPEPGPHLRCRYHGRRFALDGRCQGQPFLDGQPGFPGPEDNLPALPFGQWGDQLFAGVDPTCDLEEVLAPLRERLDFLPLGQGEPEPWECRDFTVEAPWLLYCDNYLEGLHIPFVHPGLARVLDLTTYKHVLLPWGTLQLGVVEEGAHAFDLPRDHPEAGQRIGAFYFFIFPNLMINAYPWGLSLNVVQPQGPRTTRVRYVTLIWDPSARGRGAGENLETVEREDEAVVEAVALSLRARRARTGTYVPQHEEGLRHVHRLLAEMLAN